MTFEERIRKIKEDAEVAKLQAAEEEKNKQFDVVQDNNHIHLTIK